MDRSKIDKIAQTQEDKMLLSMIWDKVNAGIQRCIPTHTPFLTPRELEMTRYLFGEPETLYSFGGYTDAERRMLVYLPEYLDESWLYGEDSPVVCLHCTFYEGDTPNHRDFLGALMGSGIARSAIGDICVDKGCCDFFVTAEISPYLLQNFSSAGRTKLRIIQIPVSQAHIPTPEVRIIRDSLASMRLDSVLSSGFRIGRSLAAQHISAGKVTVNGLVCEKPDKTVEQGAKIALRGSGKILLAGVNGQTKKGRISVEIHRYL